MTTLALRPPAGPQPDPRGPAVGLGLSLLVHAAVLAWLMRTPAPRPADPAPVARMQIWLAPPRPARPVQPKMAPAPAVQAAVPAARPAQPTPRRQPRARQPAPVRASEAPAILSAPAAGSEADYTPPPAAADADAGPTVDLAAARQAAREIARADSKNLVALPRRKPVVDPNADHQVDDPLERARRSDCKTAYAGLGILALIPLAKDAITGSGCKW